MTYRQITSGERYMLAALRTQGCSASEIARVLGRHPSSISREIRRNCCNDGAYRPSKADRRTRGRRSRSRRNRRFTGDDIRLVEGLLPHLWSPEQVAAWLKRHGMLSISHETIYQHVWRDKRRGGRLYEYLRCAGKQRRKRYGRYDSRGRLAGKRHISERPASVEQRSEIGHWEIDTVMGNPLRKRPTPGQNPIGTVGQFYIGINSPHSIALSDLRRTALHFAISTKWPLQRGYRIKTLDCPILHCRKTLQNECLQ